MAESSLLYRVEMHARASYHAQKSGTLYCDTACQSVSHHAEACYGSFNLLVRASMPQNNAIIEQSGII